MILSQVLNCYNYKNIYKCLLIIWDCIIVLIRILEVRIMASSSNPAGFWVGLVLAIIGGIMALYFGFHNDIFWMCVGVLLFIIGMFAMAKSK